MEKTYQALIVDGNRMKMHHLTPSQASKQNAKELRDDSGNFIGYVILPRDWKIT